jgi:serine/threonine protein kinase
MAKLIALLASFSATEGALQLARQRSVQLHERSGREDVSPIAAHPSSIQNRLTVDVQGESPIYQMFLELSEQCFRAGPVYDSDSVDRCFCEQPFVIDVLGRGPVEFSDEVLGDGKEGISVRSLDGDLVLKLSTTGGPLCIEQAALKSLNGLEGFFPNVYSILEPPEKDCERFTMVMDLVGDIDWKEFPHKANREFFIRAAKLIEAVKLLHDTGLRHGDLHQGNIRIESKDPTKVYLIDFGSSGDDTVSTRKKDMVRVARALKVILGENSDFEKEMLELTKSETPRYDYWILYFSTQGN